MRETSFPTGARKRMTCETIMFEVIRNMIGRFRGSELRVVTCDTFRRSIYKLIRLLVHVARLAIDGNMRSEQRKARELMLRDLFVRRSPAHRRVTILALITEFTFVLIFMTGIARDTIELDGIFFVTTLAFDIFMLTDENEAREFVIELDVRFQFFPRFCRMAGHALLTE